MSSALAKPASEVQTLIQQNPVRFCEKVLGFTPWSKQREVLEAIRDHKRVAVRSCHGSGKTANAARAALWFLAAYPDSRVITTAPTYTQVRDLLWAEIHSATYKAPAGFFPQASSTRLSITDNWYATGVSTNQPERFQGHHAENLLLIVDEASGVDEDIYSAAEGFMTSEGARVLLIGNPTRTSGQFYRAFHSERDQWHTIHISAYDTPNLTGEPVVAAAARTLVSPGWVAEKEKYWGADNPMFQVRVLGDFPTSSDDSVVGLAAVEAAQKREVAPDDSQIVVSCDVARYGADETVIVVRRGLHARIHSAYFGKSLMETAGRIMDAARSVSDYGVPRIVVDDAGLGGGVTDRLREQGVKVEAFNSATTAHDKDIYPNRRSEAWFHFADMINDIDLDPDDQLAADLVACRYTMDSSGRRAVEPKDHTKKRLGRSPDRADAILMAFAPPVKMGASYGPDIWSD